MEFDKLKDGTYCMNRAERMSGESYYNKDASFG